MTSNFVKQVLQFENEKKELQIENLKLKKKQTELEKTIRELKNENSTKIEKIEGELKKCKVLLQKKEANESKPYIIKIYDEEKNLYGSARIEKTKIKNGKASPTKSLTNGKASPTKSLMNVETIEKDFQIPEDEIIEEEDLETEELRKKYEILEKALGREKVMITEVDDINNEDNENNEGNDNEENEDEDIDNEDNEDNEDNDDEEINNEEIDTVADLDQSYQNSYDEKNDLNVMDKVWITYASDNEFEYVYSANVVEIVDDNTVKCQMYHKENSPPIEVLKCDCYMSPSDNLYVPIYKKNSTMDLDQEIKVGLRVFIIAESNNFGRMQDYFYEGEISKIIDNKVEVYFQDDDRFEQIPIKECLLHPSLNKSKVKIFKHVEYLYNNHKSSHKKRKTTNAENEFETPSKMSKKNNEESASKINKGDVEEERLCEFMKNQIVHSYVLDYINSNYELTFNEDDGIPRKVFSDQFRGDMRVRFDLMKKKTFTNESKVKFEFLELMMNLFTKYGMMAGGFMKHVKLITNLMKAFEENCEKFLKSRNKNFKFTGKIKYLLTAKAMTKKL